ncbi:MAG: hypothetical protein WBA84_06840 [Carnobacterium sp.]|uniref:hypothetical protein n=1 Tax=Carnobacterium sp. TaxID=48221 RepID=UPI003C7921C3
MVYEVTARFKDVKDGKVYEIGDKYDKELTEERAAVLSTKDNAYQTVFLKLIEEKEDEEDVKKKEKKK